MISLSVMYWSWELFKPFDICTLLLGIDFLLNKNINHLMILWTHINSYFITISTTDLVMLYTENMIGLLMQILVLYFILMRHIFANWEMSLYLLYWLEFTFAEFSSHVLKFSLFIRILRCFVHLIHCFQYRTRTRSFHS